MNEDDMYEKKLAFLVNQCDFLKKSFDSVQIFASFSTGDNTAVFTPGVGNWQARRNMVREWQIGQDEIVKENARKKLWPTPSDER